MVLAHLVPFIGHPDRGTVELTEPIESVCFEPFLLFRAGHLVLSSFVVHQRV
jgi:hypothetical protein